VAAGGAAEWAYMEVRIRISLLLCLGALTGVSAVGTAAAHGAAKPGVAPDLTWAISDSDKRRTIESLHGARSRWVRLDVQWRQAQPSRGSYDQWWIHEYGQAIEMARRAGQRVVLMAYNAPAWASGSPRSNVPRKPRDFARFMAHLARTYRGKVSAYEVWNEPNLERFWSTGPSPRAYTRLLKVTYRAIKSVDRKAKVVFGGLSLNDYKFVRRAYRAGAKGHFDVMATHPYTYCGTTGPRKVRRSHGRITPDSFLAYRKVRRVMVARHDAGPIWFTEFGWNTSTEKCNPRAGIWQGGVSQRKQARYLRQSFRLVRRTHYVKVALWYNFRNNYWQHDANTPEARYGLVRSNYSRKPAYRAFRRYATRLR
jgi:polysaccharide biosynthesis protein PslG